ncbi:two-component system, OmpR family, phosphate regulon sensor histidine kinase PhoR [Arboricoccus pini]|uniref:histidine kinase n=1 Tax=Arboricoccus pini TaxID=1963835 RepID=A0A212QPF9_9PROT|nr:ATP-binding protein [Arboricoccus pini]SNB61302.1 two-component system, OmpR family, phosphate regulon sensor histidine kinase PhoR [Arboricoccus pini]
MRSWRLVVLEAILIALPGLLALLAVLVTGAAHLAVGIGLGVVLLIVLACVHARRRGRDASRLLDWLNDLVTSEPLLDDGSERASAAPNLHGPLRFVARSIADMAELLADRGRRLRRQERSLATIVAGILDPILVVDRHRAIDLANPAADRAFGVRLNGLPLTRAIRDPGVLAAVDAAIGTGSANNVAFSPTLDRGKQFIARVMPISLRNGLPGVLLALREQSEHVLIERMRSDFVANASHEIRTPLASIIGITETLQGPAKDDAAAREMFLEMMADEARRMQRLIDDLLSLSKIEVAANQQPEASLDAQAVVEEVIDRLRKTAREVNSHLSLTPVSAERTLPPVRADHDQLHQMVFNLVDNALKYGAGRPVDVTLRHLARAEGDVGPLTGRPCLEIAITDHGEGIPPEHLGRLTERFYRVDKARSRKIGGTGLGLAIVKHIVRRHQGHLRIESRLGLGSCFSIFLPLADIGDPAKAAIISEYNHETIT